MSRVYIDGVIDRLYFSCSYAHYVYLQQLCYYVSHEVQITWSKIMNVDTRRVKIGKRISCGCRSNVISFKISCESCQIPNFDRLSKETTRNNIEKQIMRKRLTVDFKANWKIQKASKHRNELLKYNI